MYTEKFHENPIVVTIDGPAGSGKTSIAREAADRIEGFAYLDTGAVYRAMAYVVDEAGFGAGDMAESKGKCLDAIYAADISIRYDGSGRQAMCLRQNAIRDELLRTQEISELASALSADPVVRLFAKYIIGRRPPKRSVFVEGRDAGTALFPDAQLKFYLYAEAHERARRRALQKYGALSDSQVAEIQRDLDKRDVRDITRKSDPLRCAPGAIWLDTTDLSKRQVLDIVIGAARAAIDPGAVPLS